MRAADSGRQDRRQRRRERQDQEKLSVPTQGGRRGQRARRRIEPELASYEPIVGRPLDVPDRRAAFIQAIRQGLPRTRAAALAGIRRRSLERWLRVEPAFAREVEAAEARAIRRNLRLLRRAAKKDWRAAAWWLERRYPDEWGRREQIEHTGQRGGPLRLVFSVAGRQEEREVILDTDRPALPP